MQSIWFSGNKVKVFISSKCGGRYAPVRSALKLLLEESGIADVYVYELAHGSTQDNKSAYLDEVKKREVCVFLIHNADAVADGGIRPAVLDEYRCAREWKKRCVFAFCDEPNEGDTQIPPATEMQKEIERSQGEKYVPIKTFSDFTTNVYRTVMNDIIDVYHAYCAGSLARQEGHAEALPMADISDQKTHIGNLLNSEIRSQQQTIQAYNDSPEKRFTKGFRRTEKQIANFMVAWPDELDDLHDEQQLDDHPELDELCSQFALALIGKKSLPKNFFKSLNQEVGLFLGQGTPLAENVQLRLKAVAAYWSDHLPTCMKYLKQAYTLALKTDGVPSWFLNDIIIDLRHVNSLQKSAAGKESWLNNKWDKILSGQKNDLQYPLLDRIESSLYEQAFKIFMDDKTTAPYTTRFGIGYEGVASKAAHTLILAIMHGSLVQILHTRNRLADGLAAFCNVYNIPEMFKSLIICNLMIQDEKALDKQMRFYHGFCGADALDKSDAADILYAVELIPVSYFRDKSYLLLLQYFGYQFSDEDFAQLENRVKIIIKSWMAQERRYRHMEVAPYIACLVSSAWRFDSDFITDFASYIIQNVPFALINKLGDLVKHLDYTRVANAKLLQMALSFASGYENPQINEDSHWSQLLTDALLAIRMRTNNPIIHQALDDAVQQHNPKAFALHYGLNILIPDQKTEAMEFIHQFIANITERNAKSNKTGTFHGDLFRNISTVQFLIEKHNIFLAVQDVKMIKDILRDILFMKAQTPSEKEDAIKLLICLQNTYGDQVSDLISDVLQQEEIVSHCIESHYEFTGKGNKQTVAFSLLMLKAAVQRESAIEVVSHLANFAHATSGELISLLLSIFNLLSFADLNCLQTKTLSALLQFCLSMSSHDERNVRYHAAQNLVCLSGSEDLSELVLSALSEMMQCDHPEVRAEILRKLRKTETKTPKVDYIVQQGLVDNSWSIRRLAQINVDKNK